MRGDGERFEARLRDVGVPVASVMVRGAIHHVLGADGAATALGMLRAFLDDLDRVGAR